MKEECNCGRPDLHYKFEFGKCPVPNQESTESWEESWRRTQKIFDGNETDTCDLCGINPVKFKEELQKERQKAKEETLAMVLKEIELIKKPIKSESGLIMPVKQHNNALDTLKREIKS